MPDQRPVTDGDVERIRAAMAGVSAAQERLEQAVAEALLNGASVRSVAALGFSANTVQKYGRAHGWPTAVNRSRFYESLDARDERAREAVRGGPASRLLD
ncbi:hypothetical protein [Blastococcus sp. URHD0036]|uniref:hypothetical protein n=1 Tax=Blastococcus sp. URHD0036 TaxID=1380356 RepID=UPI00054D7347|nr:hypothetical protein [Blastococcus sp. URHD0036]